MVLPVIISVAYFEELSNIVVVLFQFSSIICNIYS